MIGRSLILLAAGVSFAAGSAAGWWGRSATFAWFDRPSIIREQEALCASRTEAAAAAAMAAEQLRQFRAGERAATEFDLKQQQMADDWAAQRTVLEREIADYEQRLDESGRVCALDVDDLRFLGGVRGDGTPAGGGAAAGAGPGQGHSAEPAIDLPAGR
ncbi:hypothetical protein [Devosia sp. DBB001]|nr:hypothetical protein [Devosia sp. DBB001]